MESFLHLARESVQKKNGAAHCPPPLPSAEERVGKNSNAINLLRD